MHVQEILKIYTADSGCTCPVRVVLSDRREAILKYPNNPQGIIVLLNEYFSYALADAVGLSVPSFGIATINEETVLSADLCGECLASTFFGDCFFCEYIPAALKVSGRMLRNISNIEEVPRMVLFDFLVNNCDRHAANVLVDAKANPPRMYAIDYSHAFGDPDWDTTTLRLDNWASPYVWIQNREFYEMLLRSGASITLENLQDEAALMQAKIDENLLNAVVAQIPVQWQESLGKTKIQHAVQYILNRVASLPQVCETIMKERGV